jgi:uncharacterized protein (DUF427 family)
VAAWYCADPFDAAAEIRDHVAFWKGVETGPTDGTRRLPSAAGSHG